MTTIATLDPYTAKAENTNLTPQEKINGLKEIIKETHTAMLTTRSADGEMHSRAMTPASPYSDTQLTLAFIANNVSHKFDEIQNDSHVNVSFYDTNTTNWASFSGKAKVTTDHETVKKYWSSSTAAWFGDLKDGVHKGDANDPRVAVIEVVPDEIRYWITTKSKIGRATSVPGELRTITKDEIQLTQGLHTK
ncbi:hypothetical protein BDQ17DRAFT_1397328 [Cyathus striatus]|nr:hypothetical protein BDQ17DRAFT_1397328 [Cyathus striatus]